MKLINETSCEISCHVQNGLFHLTISHKSKEWFGGTDYRGGGCLSYEKDATHFEMYDDYLSNENMGMMDESGKYKEFCLIPENSIESALIKGRWFFSQNKEEERFVCIPKVSTLEELKQIEEIKLTIIEK